MYVHLYKNEQKGLCPGGILSYIQLEALYRVRIPFDEKWLVLSEISKVCDGFICCGLILCLIICSN